MITGRGVGGLEQGYSYGHTGPDRWTPGAARQALPIAPGLPPGAAQAGKMAAMQVKGMAACISILIGLLDSLPSKSSSFGVQVRETIASVLRGRHPFPFAVPHELA